MKQFSVAMLGYGIAGKAFARILNQTHDEIMEKTGYDVKVVANNYRFQRLSVLHGRHRPERGHKTA